MWVIGVVVANVTDGTFDAIIIGAGPAGLSAAVYLARFLRSTLVIDGGHGRSMGPQTNENYLGFPRGIKARRLRELGRQQAERFGARFIEGTISTACRTDGHFILQGDCGEWRGRALVIATGVTDIWPSFPDVQRYVGRSLFWCITCDGFRTRGKRTVLIGAGDEAAVTACQFLRYTRDLTFLAMLAPDGSDLSAEHLETLRGHGIRVILGAVDRVEGARGQVRQVVVGGERIDADLLFSLLGAAPNVQVAGQLGALLDAAGYIRIDKEQRTSVPGLYAAGDVTGPYAHQVSSAVHEGAMAAQALNYDLYDEFQRE